MTEAPSPRSLILASSSPYRRELLARLGLPFRALTPECDEDDFKSQGLSPHELVLTLAFEKARSLTHLHPEALVIGSDQMALFRGELLGKAGSREAAIAQLEQLAGGTHELLTAVALIQPAEEHSFIDCTRLTFRSLTRAQIERYVDADEPWDCAGSYKIESRGIALFERIETADWSAIQGLPLIQLSSHLHALGFPVP